MKPRTSGNSGLEVSALGMGCMNHSNTLITYGSSKSVKMVGKAVFLVVFSQITVGSFALLKIINNESKKFRQQQT